MVKPPPVFEKNENMKTIIAFLLTVFSATIEGQAVYTPIQFQFSDSMMFFETSNFYRIEDFDFEFLLTVDSGELIYEKKYLTINGDTANGILYLLKDRQRLQDRLDAVYSEYEKFVKASVDFSNQVPDWWKKEENNCGWRKYYLFLKRNGYHIELGKPTGCCN